MSTLESIGTQQHHGCAHRSRVLRIAVLAAALVILLAAPAYAAVGDFLGKWGSSGAGDGQFVQPSGIAVAPNGDVYVADTNNHRVQRFGPTGVYKGKWGSPGSADGQFSFPSGIAVAPNGDVYVTDYSNHRIQRFGPTGAYIGKWGSSGSGDGQFSNPYCIAIAPNGDVYVGDYTGHRIQRFSSTGTFKGKWGSNGSADGQFDFPNGITIAPTGDVYVADQGNHRIQRFGPTGTFKSKWGSFGTGNGQFNLPSSVAFGPNGEVYVSEKLNHRIQRFSSTGAFKSKWGSFGTGNGQFSLPNSIAVASNGDVYVADANNHRIQRFRGVTAIQHDAGGVTFSRFVSGYNAAYSGGGYVYSRWAGETLEVRFYGTKIKWVGPKQPNYGKASVYLDGNSMGVYVDCYASAAARTTEAVLYESPTLTEGLHTLRIKVSATRNPASTGTIVVLDRFEIDGANPKAYAGRSDEKFGSFAGPWIYGANSAYIAKGYHYSRYPNAVYTAAFYGTRVAWIGPKTGAYGRAKVYINGVQQGTVVSQYGTMGWRERVWESPALPRGVHTIKIVPTGTKDAASTSTNIVIDAIDVVP